MTLELVSRLLVALLLGGMTFFAAFMSPLVFIKLPPATAGGFIRAVFPWYYDVMTALAFSSALACAAWAPGPALTLAAVGLGFPIARFGLMPRINRLRDRQLAGDAAAGAGFGRLHRASVLINTAQWIAVGWVAVLLYR